MQEDSVADKFTVVMSLYKNDEPAFFNEALESIIGQTVKPAEIILVADGSLPTLLDKALTKWSRHKLIKVLRLPSNLGLGASRHIAIQKSRNTIIAVMDSDDISVPNRFELQLEYIKSKDADVVGGYIEEFRNKPGDLRLIRSVPLEHGEIVKRGQWRSPMNHVTIMFQKAAYMNSGGYKGFRRVEDYDMFARMIHNGVKFANIPKVLVLVRFSEDQYYRRRGLAYFKEEVGLFYRMLKMGNIGIIVFGLNLAIRVVTRLFPRQLLSWMYKSILRRKA